MSIPTRPLGRNGPQVSGIGLGLMSFAGFYGQQDTGLESSLKFLDRAHEIGERFWDTADAYTGSEERVGEWFRRSGKRDDIFLATKFGLRSIKGGSSSVTNDPAWIREACQKSLDRLGVETIDLYYCHRVDDKTPIEHTVQTMVELKKRLVDDIAAVARRHGATPAQICLAWVAAQGDDVIPIPGTTTIRYLEENTSAVHIKLSEEEVRELTRCAKETELTGDRYPSAMDTLLRDSVPLA
ncbi:hypothetical protein E4U53_004790 [Claviceps sorghi]|nr:hypothetical protein E4U53_004790 [Claviceps sorghi]